MRTRRTTDSSGNANTTAKDGPHSLHHSWRMAEATKQEEQATDMEAAAVTTQGRLS